MRGRRRGTPGQDRWERSDWWGVVLDSPDPKALARFYSELLGWPLWKPEEMDPGEAAIDAGEGVVGITFHLKEDPFAVDRRRQVPRILNSRRPAAGTC